MSNPTIMWATELSTIKATDVIRNERVRTQFINVYNSIWTEGGEQAYEREAIYFNQQLRDKPNLRECSGLSVFYAFIDLAVKGLTLAGGAQPLCYLIPRSVKAGTDARGNDVWEKACNLTISGYGELVLRKNAGQIRHADNPVIVYEGDSFEYGEKDGKKFVNYMSSFPRKSNKITGIFMKITRADGSVDYSVMAEDDWKRLKNYSDKQNSYFDRKTNQWVTKSNELYSKDGQIDTGFLIAKCIKHAFKTYPKINIGKGSVMESDIIDNPYAPYQGNPGLPVAEHQEPPNCIPNPGEDVDPAMTAGGGVTFDPAEDNDGTF